MFYTFSSTVQFLKKNLTRCNTVSKFYYSIFIWRSTCFGRHTVHHQEPKTALAISSFSYMEGCWTCSWWTLSGTLCLTTSTNYTSKTRGCQCSFRLLMMGGVLPETCWASYKYGIIKMWMHCCILLDFFLRIVLWCADPRMSSSITVFQSSYRHSVPYTTQQ
jgi:hypothetical protein